MNDEDRERAEQVLRRLLTEAVEAVAPAPGAQARLQARYRAADKPERKLPAALRWSAAGLTAAAVAVVAVLFTGHLGSSNGSSSSSTAGSAASVGGASSGPVPARAPAAAPDSPAALPAVPAPESSQLQPSASGFDAAGGTGAGTAPKAASAASNDLDGDGTGDVLRLDAGRIVARLSRDGLQAATLPTLGSGARVLGVTVLQTPVGAGVPVAFVRLQDRPGYAQDTMVALAGGRLTVLRLGATPVALTVDATHGYACEGMLTLAGQPNGEQEYAITGAELTRSLEKEVRTSIARAGQVNGCGW